MNSLFEDEASNPLDGVRDLIVRNGAGVFDGEKLGQIDDLVREAGSGVYGRVGPILGEVRTFHTSDGSRSRSFDHDLVHLITI